MLGINLSGSLAAPGLLAQPVAAEPAQDAELDDLLNEILESGERALEGVTDPLTASLADVAGDGTETSGDIFDLAPAVDGALRTLFGAADAEVEAFSALTDIAPQHDLLTEDQHG